MSIENPKTQVPLYIPRELKEQIKRESEKQLRSMNAQITWILEQHYNPAPADD